MDYIWFLAPPPSFWCCYFLFLDDFTADYLNEAVFIVLGHSEWPSLILVLRFDNNALCWFIVLCATFGSVTNFCVTLLWRLTWLPPVVRSSSFLFEGSTIIVWCWTCLCCLLSRLWWIFVLLSFGSLLSAFASVSLDCSKFIEWTSGFSPSRRLLLRYSLLAASYGSSSFDSSSMAERTVWLEKRLLLG